MVKKWIVRLGVVHAGFFFASGVAQTLWAGEETVVEEVTKDHKGSEETFKYKIVEIAPGVQYRMPEDANLIRKDGVLQPVPVDEYIYQKFKRLDTRIDSINSRLEKIQLLIESQIEQSKSVADPSKDAEAQKDSEASSQSAVSKTREVDLQGNYYSGDNSNSENVVSQEKGDVGTTLSFPAS